MAVISNVVQNWNTFLVLALQLLWAMAVFQSPDLFTIGRTPWRSDQLVTRGIQIQDPIYDKDIKKMKYNIVD
jgi:hypothetical protein